MFTSCKPLNLNILSNVCVCACVEAHVPALDILDTKQFLLFDILNNKLYDISKIVVGDNYW